MMFSTFTSAYKGALRGNTMKQTSNLFARISQLLLRGVGKQQITMFYGQGERGLGQEAWTRSVLKESHRSQELLRTPLRILTYTSLDIETTGFHPEHGDEILSIGAVRMKGTELSDTDFFSTYVRPSCPIRPHITALTGITEEDVLDAPRLQDIYSAFATFLEDTILIGYYIGHEIKFFNHFLWRTYRQRFAYRTLDMKKVAECVYPSLSDYQLEHVLEVSGIAITRRHCALSDARMTGELWGKLQEQLEAKGVHTLEDLYAYLANDGRQS
jgi:DNA polymerase-3 subunit epsilon